MLADARPDPTSTEAAGHPLAPIPYVVRSVALETPDTTTLVLEPRGTRRIPSTRPGQFVMLYAFGVGESPIGVSGGNPDGQLVHTVRNAGKVTQALTRLTPGDAVGVRGPYGRGWPLADARGKDVVIVAGGLGLPPLRQAVYELFYHRELYGRVEIIYGARTPKDLVYYNEIQTWRRRNDIRLQVTVDAAGRDWYGDVGVVTTRLPDSRFEPGKTIAFVCGPEIMMKLTAQALVARGVKPEATWVSMERNMKCAIGLCGHCQFGPSFVCRDGPVLSYRDLGPLLGVREV
jgi:NAD(P)H-flavin reductase